MSGSGKVKNCTSSVAAPAMMQGLARQLALLVVSTKWSTDVAEANGVSELMHFTAGCVWNVFDRVELTTPVGGTESDTARY